MKPVCTGPSLVWMRPQMRSAVWAGRGAARDAERTKAQPRSVQPFACGCIADLEGDRTWEKTSSNTIAAGRGFPFGVGSFGRTGGAS